MYKVILRDKEFEVGDVHNIHQEEGLIILYDETNKLICMINQNELICISKVIE